MEASSGQKFMLKSYEWSPVWNIRSIYWTFWPRPLSPPSAPCKLSSLGRAHHSTILAISVLKSTTMYDISFLLQERLSFLIENDQLRLMKITMVWCNWLFKPNQLEHQHQRQQKHQNEYQQQQNKLGCHSYNLETYFAIKTSEMLSSFMLECFAVRGVIQYFVFNIA